MSIIAADWKDFELIDCGDGMKLERWGDIVLARPDPQAIWAKQAPKLWKKADAVYHRSQSGGGNWEFIKKFPQKWTVNYKGMKLYVEPTGFKHTGIFPEQAANWDFMTKLIEKRVSEGRQVKILNLFGYTGAATVACAKAGAEVCHVDASKGIVTRCRENVELTGLHEAKVRYLIDDAFKFVSREIRRGNHYDGIIMDPPSYGRGPNGEVWKLEDSIYSFLEESVNLLYDDSLFFILNSYTTGLSPVVTENMLKVLICGKFGGKVESGDLCLPCSASDLVLPCGSVARWTK